MTNTGVTIGEIEAAQKRIADKIRATLMNRSESLSKISGAPVWLKLEHQQLTGSFKLRGATNAIACLTPEQKQRGVVAVSTGNHGRGLAYAARNAGVDCVICMSSLVPQVKVDGIKAQGANVRICGRSQDEAQIEADGLMAEGLTMIPPFDHRDVIAGQGTLGLDVMAQLPEVDTLIVPLSGGGLIAGVAAAAKARKPSIRIVGVTMENGAAMIESLAAGHPVEVVEVPSLADSLGGGIGLDNQLTFSMVRDLVDETFTVTEAEIAEAMRHIYFEERQIVEGSAAVGVAALLSGKLKLSGPAVVVLSGGNVDMQQHLAVMNGAGESVLDKVG